MRVEERALFFDCGGEQLAGVLARPEQASGLGVVIVVGGPQYRAGSHRQFVLLARHLAAQGVPALRFDSRGMGDSSGKQRTFESMGEDIRHAIDTLVAAEPAVRTVALWGLCDGASAALLYLDEYPDPRVGALCLVNPWVRSATSLARTHIEHHYRRRLHDPAFWARFLTGRVGTRALAGLWGNVKLSLATRQPSVADPQRSFQQRMADAWRKFQGGILLLLSENDYTADEFRDALAGDPIWHGAASHAGLRRHDISGADHTLSQSAVRESTEALTSSWLLRLAAAQRVAAP